MAAIETTRFENLRTDEAFVLPQVFAKYGNDPSKIPSRERIVRIRDVKSKDAVRNARKGGVDVLIESHVMVVRLPS